MLQALLDTNIVSALMRRDPIASAKANAYLKEHSQLTFSIITQFEIIRGRKGKGSTRRLTAFRMACEGSLILPLTGEIVEHASDIYAYLYKHGTLIEDADMLIAATALVHGLVLVTDNEKHFSRVVGLQLENWLM